MPALLAEAANPRPEPRDAPISVLIVAKDPISRAGVERQLHAARDIAVLSPSGAKAHPDVALVVADVIDEAVLGWIRTIRRHTMSRIVVVATVTGQAAAWATDAGANGVLPRAMADSRRLTWVIQKVHRGDALALVIGDERLEAPAAEPPVTPAAGPILSARDREVLRLLADGCDTTEIAQALAYSEPTIKNAIQRLFDQLKARNRPHAVALALRQGII
ncbi:MAG TPA: LuxR C-terminal-related transcriptional regulator [Acidimicrobiales bacterium]|jgi:DNA-binding NarL/FixJ family response regulator|nr:LuxR C-terminal-related transcriptional regulator [Acidimicrobiales bacterium]